MTKEIEDKYQSKRIDVALEEYKALRAEIVTLTQNRNNLIVFGFAGLVTLISVGVTIFSSSLDPSGLSRTKTTTYSEIVKEINPAGVSNGVRNTEVTKPYTITETELPIYDKKDKEGLTVYDKNIRNPRRIASAIVFIVAMPLSCMYISFFWVRNTRHIFFISNYIANNLEKKINFLYLEEECEVRKHAGGKGKDLIVMPLSWEMLMCAQDFPIGEFLWFVLPYALMGITSIVSGTVILCFSYGFYPIPLGLLVIWGYLIFIRYNIHGLRFFRNKNYTENMKNRIDFKKLDPDEGADRKEWVDWIIPKLGLPLNNIDHSVIAAWKKEYVEEFKKLEELEK